MTFKVIRGQGQGQEMTPVPSRDYFYYYYYTESTSTSESTTTTIFAFSAFILLVGQQEGHNLELTTILFIEYLFHRAFVSC